MIDIVSGHGRLIKPVPRIGDRDSYENDPVGFANRPMEHFVCRHKEASVITSVIAGEKLDVSWSLSAPHPGDCSFYVSYDVDAPLTDMKWFKVANLMNCWGERKGQGEVPYTEEWKLVLPKWLPKGRAVIRWEWAAIHVPSAIEFFVQCADVDITPTASEISLNQIPRFLLFSNGKPQTLPSKWTDMSYTPNIPKDYSYSYRSEYNAGGYGYWPQFMTGPSCAFPETKQNNCEETAPATLGWVPMDESRADPVDLPEEDPVDTEYPAAEEPEENEDPSEEDPKETEDPTQDGNGKAEVEFPFYFHSTTLKDQRKTMANIAGLLAQCMWESGGDAPWSACDENNYTNSPTAACTQRGDGVKYADLGSPDGSDGSCVYVSEMTMTAETHATWTPGPMKCAPGTVTEGCCWWGRGAIQTTGRFNYGHLQSDVVSKLGLDVDLCKNPEAMCQHEVLKMTGALYYWTTKVQTDACFAGALDTVAQDFDLDAKPAPGCSDFTAGVGGAINNGRWNSTPHGSAGRKRYMQALVDSIETTFTAWNGQVKKNAYQCTGDEVIDTLLDLANVESVSKLHESTIYNWRGFCTAMKTFLRGSDLQKGPVEPAVEGPAKPPQKKPTEPVEDPVLPVDPSKPGACANGSKYGKWDKCGGADFPVKTGVEWDGCPECPTDFECYQKNEWYSQCAKSCEAGWDCSKDKPVKVADPVVTEKDCPNDEWDACGGQGLAIPAQWSGETCCKAGLYCNRSSKWWSSCLRM